MSPRIAICDYGMGNLRSVEKALEKVGAEPVVTSDSREIARADGAILPGVGAFPRAMENLSALGLREPLLERIGAGRPVLGICLGFQLLFDGTTEHGGAEGLGFLPGPVELLDAPGLKVPHIGWAVLETEHESALLSGMDSDPAFYFVHSYAPRPAERGDVLASATYGNRFVCAVERDGLYGVQFHPEKSSSAGLRLLANFAAACDRAAAPV